MSLTILIKISGPLHNFGIVLSAPSVSFWKLPKINLSIGILYFFLRSVLWIIGKNCSLLIQKLPITIFLLVILLNSVYVLGHIVWYRFVILFIKL